MPEFHLDTSGAVCVLGTPAFNPVTRNALCLWSDLSHIARGYIEALFFTETEGSIEAGTFDPETGSALPEEAGFSSLAPGAVSRAITDCAAFEASPAWQAFLASEAWYDQDEAQCGRNLWYTRNGHGCGFWDGDYPEPHASALTGAAKALGETWACWGDDERVHLN